MSAVGRGALRLGEARYALRGVELVYTGTHLQFVCITAPPRAPGWDEPLEIFVRVDDPLDALFDITHRDLECEDGTFDLPGFGVGSIAFEGSAHLSLGLPDPECLPVSIRERVAFYGDSGENAALRVALSAQAHLVIDAG